jgi:nitrite reductase (NADH) small subunit
VSTVTYNLGPVALIPLGEGRMFEAGDAVIAVFRTREGRVHAVEPWCPHRGGPLADGIVAGGKVVCPLHGYMFALETGAPIHHECRRLRTYAVRLNDQDDVLVTMRRRVTSEAVALPSPPSPEAASPEVAIDA